LNLCRPGEIDRMTQMVSIDISNWQLPEVPRETDPFAIIEWGVRRFRDRSIVMATAFGMEGVVLLDMLAPRLPGLRVISVDTGFLFAETHRLRVQLEARYPAVRFETVLPQLSPEEQARRYGDGLWRSDPGLCCAIRKVEPMRRAMQGVDVLFSSIRRDQSETRQAARVVEWDWLYQAIRVCPLAQWTRRQVYDYVVEHDLPYNELHDRHYPSVGCTHCTRPVEGAQQWDYSRAGRWPGHAMTECGLNGHSTPKSAGKGPR
jgi:phosphoadenosine phosphosulfate reductase